MRAWLGLLGAAVFLGFLGFPESGPRITTGQDAAFPEGKGAELVRWRCTFCHSIDAGSLPRQDLQGWTETVDRMIRWGTPLGPEEREILLRYLTAHFGAPPLSGERR